MNIVYLAIPVIVGLVIGVSVFIFQHSDLTGKFVSPVINNTDNENDLNIQENQTKCSTSCDDNNPCTIDWCNETSNYFCAYIPINGTSDGCWGNPTTCSVNKCVSGKCSEMIIANCCGNNICESSESCSSCAGDCGECPTIIPENIQQPVQTNTEISQTNNTLTPNQAIPTNQTSNETSNQTLQTTLNHIIISEVQTGPNEFVELYNPTSTNVNVAGWYLSYFSSNRDWNNTYRNWAFPNSTTLKAGKFFLINIFNTSNSDWTVLTSAGNPYSLGQINNTYGAIALFPFNPRIKTPEEARNGRVDAIGWGTPTYVFESSPAVPETNKSLQRKSLNADTDNNLQDFELNTIPSPQNSAFQ